MDFEEKYHKFEKIHHFSKNHIFYEVRTFKKEKEKEKRKRSRKLKRKQCALSNTKKETLCLSSTVFQG